MIEIYDENMQPIVNPDLSLGYLYDGERTVHHKAVEDVAEKWHWETVTEYPNGGKDVQKVVDVPGIPARPAWDEKVPIKIYHEYTKKEFDDMNKPTTDERLTALEGKAAQWETAYIQGVNEA